MVDKKDTYNNNKEIVLGDKYDDKQVISPFVGEYEYLSNFYEAPLAYKGVMYLSSESAYQAHKFTENHKDFSWLTPMKAKKLARKREVREDWEEVKYQIMLEIVREKFTQNWHLQNKLIETGDVLLVEGNYWGDTYWGVCNGEGTNYLGKILMQVREEAINKK